MTSRFAVAVLAAATSFPAIDARAQTFATLYRFKGGSDGIAPTAGLLVVGNTLYGTTFNGGVTGNGTVFSVDPNTGSETVLYGFTGGADGGQPYAGLIDYGGFLWGTTYDGGASNDGTVFKINLAMGAETTVYTFTGVPDGSHARGQLVYHQGLLFGTTFDGGKYDGGTVFSINPKAGTEAVLYSFSVAPTASLLSRAWLLRPGLSMEQPTVGAPCNTEWLSRSSPKRAPRPYCMISGAERTEARPSLD